MNLLERFFGANWRSSVTGLGTAIFGLLAFVSALPYTMGEVADILPPEWKPRIAIASAIAAAILKALQGGVSKDAVVTGNGTVFEPNKVADANGSNRTLAPLVLALLLPAFLLTGCTQTGAKLPAGSYFEGSAGYDKDEGTKVGGRIHIPLGTSDDAPTLWIKPPVQLRFAPELREIPVEPSLDWLRSHA